MIYLICLQWFTAPGHHRSQHDSARVYRGRSTDFCHQWHENRRHRWRVHGKCKDHFCIFQFWAEQGHAQLHPDPRWHRLLLWPKFRGTTDDGQCNYLIVSGNVACPLDLMIAKFSYWVTSQTTSMLQLVCHDWCTTIPLILLSPCLLMSVHTFTKRLVTMGKMGQNQ